MIKPILKVLTFVVVEIEHFLDKRRQAKRQTIRDQIEDDPYQYFSDNFNGVPSPTKEPDRANKADSKPDQD